MKRRAALAAAVGIAIACASGGGAPAKETAAPSAQRTPLASMAGRQVLLLPVQRNVIVVDQGMDQASAIDGWNFIVALDDSLASALTARGVGSTWTFAPAITAAAKRNGGLVGDPHVLAAGGLQKLVRAGDDPLSEPLASQIRNLVALREGRYAILPAAVRFENVAGGARGTLVVYLVDSRTARIVWSGEIPSAPSPRFSPAMAGSIAERFADLVVAR